MSEAVAKRRSRFSPKALELMQELGRVISAETYGEDGPPVQLTWNEIEELGHEIGKLTATEFDQTVQRQQAEKFDQTRQCPQCGRQCSASVKHRDLTTRGASDHTEIQGCRARRFARGRPSRWRPHPNSHCWSRKRCP